MEAIQLTADIIVLALISPANKSLSQIIINFLDNEDIKLLYQELEKCKKYSSFAQLIKTYYFLSNYLNKVDRTFYYSFYAEQPFRCIQNSHTALLATNYSNTFLQIPKQYRKCLQFIQRLFPEQTQPAQLAEEIQRMITDTDIPMPKLKRQNQGIFCKTSFQNYLVYLKFKNQCLNDYQQVFENLNAYLQNQQQVYLQKLFMKSTKDKNLGKKVRFLRFTPYEITYEKFEQNLVENNSFHNFLVAIFALTDAWLDSIQIYIQSIQDPFHRYLQLITRYSIYRNYIISIQQNLSFVFEKYNQLYQQVFGGGKPMYRFWRPAMTKWIEKFKRYHPECNKLFYYCLTKLRSEAAISFLDLKQQQQPDIYMTIKNSMALREYELNISDELKISNGVQDFFKRDKELYQAIVAQFIQYMVDLSINQETVHWCGHSEQVLSQPYLSFEKYFLEENNKYLKYIRQLEINKKTKYIFQKSYFCQQIEFFQSLEIKPLTLKKIVQCYNLQLSDSILEQAQQMETIVYDCKANNQTLKYFNQKANIKFQIPQQQIYFYSITPLVTSEQLLTKSISTNQDSGKQEQDQSDCQIQYFSRSSDVDRYANSGKFCDFEQEKSQKYEQPQQSDQEQENLPQKQYQYDIEIINRTKTSETMQRSPTYEPAEKQRKCVSKTKQLKFIRKQTTLIKQFQSFYIKPKSEIAQQQYSQTQMSFQSSRQITNYGEDNLFSNKKNMQYQSKKAIMNRHSNEKRKTFTNRKASPQISKAKLKLNNSKREENASQTKFKQSTCNLYLQKQNQQKKLRKNSREQQVSIF